METKKDIQQAAVQNVQNIYGTQINIGRVEGHYIEHVDTLIIGPCAEPAKKEEPVNKEEPVKKEYAVEVLFGDAERNRREAERFNRFLAGQGLTGTALNSAMSNAVNKAFVALYRHLDLPEQPNGDACYRFLKDGCGLTFTVGQKTYANFIRKAIDTWDDRALEEMTRRIAKAYRA
jgi:hypothetical protein